MTEREIELMLAADAAFSMLMRLRDRGVTAHSPIIEILGRALQKYGQDTGSRRKQAAFHVKHQ